MTNWFACDIMEVTRSPGGTTQAAQKVDRGFAKTSGDERSGLTVHAGTQPFDEVSRSLSSLIEPLKMAPRVFEAEGWSTTTLDRISATSDGATFTTSTTSVVLISRGALRAITTPGRFASDLAQLESLAERGVDDEVAMPNLPQVWLDGSAAVLMHEALGHPSERNAERLSWPRWLVVEDDPGADHLLKLDRDDTHSPVDRRELTGAGRPSAYRRWSFRDVPLRRMTTLVVSGRGETALSALPESRVEILFASGGSWDPATDEIAIQIAAADLVEGNRRTPIRPGVLHCPRSSLPSRFVGWIGEISAHPGVMCGDEGIQLPVGSLAVNLVVEGA